MHATSRSGWEMFSLCQARYYHVVGWLLNRVPIVAGDYLEACQEFAWIDSDSEQVDEAEEGAGDACGSLYFSV